MSNFKWIARDKDGDLWKFTHKPIKGEGGQLFIKDPKVADYFGNLEELNKELYPEVTFENSPQPYPVVAKEEEKLIWVNPEPAKPKKTRKLIAGDIVYHKATPNRKMVVLGIKKAIKGKYYKAANLEYYDIMLRNYVQIQTSYIALALWEDKDNE